MEQSPRDRDRVSIKDRGAVRWRDLRQLILEQKPHVVHFSGHGARTGELILETDSGATAPVPIDAVELLFQAVQEARAADPIRLVVLNACYSLDN